MSGTHNSKTLFAGIYEISTKNSTKKLMCCLTRALSFFSRNPKRLFVIQIPLAPIWVADEPEKNGRTSTDVLNHNNQNNDNNALTIITQNNEWESLIWRAKVIEDERNCWQDIGKILIFCSSPALQSGIKLIIRNAVPLWIIYTRTSEYLRIFKLQLTNTTTGTTKSFWKWPKPLSTRKDND